MTLYGTGARRAEVAHLKAGDVEGRRVAVHIHGGKGNRDRDNRFRQNCCALRKASLATKTSLIPGGRYAGQAYDQREPA